jgi:hypothetical protein
MLDIAGTDSDSALDNGTLQIGEITKCEKYM